MLPVYVFCLVLGGGLALLAVFGDVLDGGDVDLDADLDLEAGDPGAAAGTEVAPTAGAAETVGEIGRLFSLRGLIYGTFGFGAIGTLFHLVGLDRPLLTVGFAVAGGLMTTVLVTRLMTWVRASETGQLRHDTAFAGRSGRVLLPIGRDRPGQIRVQRAGRTHRLRALPFAPENDEVGAPEEWEDVVVVEVREGIAYVRPKEELEWM